MKYDYTTNIIILGETCSGKTTFINNYLNNKPNSTPTIGVDFYKIKFEYNSNQYLIRLWDSGGGLRYKNILMEYLQNSLIYIIIQTNKTYDFIYDVLNLKQKKLPKYIIIIYNITNIEDLHFKYNESEFINKYPDFIFSFIYINIFDNSQVKIAFNTIKNIIINHNMTQTQNNINQSKQLRENNRCCVIS